MSLSIEDVNQVLAGIEDSGIARTDLLKHRIVTDVNVKGDKVSLAIEYPSDAYPEALRKELRQRRRKAQAAAAKAAAMAAEQAKRAADRD